MKLISKSDTQGYCKAITKSGQQCKRKAFKAGYCKQHHRLKQGQTKVTDAKGNILFDVIPEPPIALGEFALIRWNVYCQFLIDEGRLIEPYLFGIAELCYLEEQLQKTQEKLNEHGSVNKYNNGFQRNGYASHYDSLQKSIRSLRADYGLTVKSGNWAPKKSKEPKSYSERKSKDW